MKSNIQLNKVRSHIDAEAVAKLAQQIWQEHYASILAQDQIDYMLKKYQSAQAIDQAIQDGYEYFLIQQLGTTLGYAAMKEDKTEGSLFLSKLYLLKDCRGKGIAANVMHQLSRICQKRGLTRIWLTVNKGNSSIQRYETLGFCITHSKTTDIGNGYVMDDYIMEKHIVATTTQ